MLYFMDVVDKVVYCVPWRVRIFSAMNKGGLEVKTSKHPKKVVSHSVFVLFFLPLCR